MLKQIVFFSITNRDTAAVPTSYGSASLFVLS